MSVISCHITKAERKVLEGKVEKEGKSIAQKLRELMLSYIGGEIVKEVKGVEFYDASRHKAGDRVLINKGGKVLQVVVPELDADGNPIRW